MTAGEALSFLVNNAGLSVRVFKEENSSMPSVEVSRGGDFLPAFFSAISNSSIDVLLEDVVRYFARAGVDISLLTERKNPDGS